MPITPAVTATARAIRSRTSPGAGAVAAVTVVSGAVVSGAVEGVAESLAAGVFVVFVMTGTMHHGTGQVVTGFPARLSVCVPIDSWRS